LTEPPVALRNVVDGVVVVVGATVAVVGGVEVGVVGVVRTGDDVDVFGTVVGGAEDVLAIPGEIVVVERCNALGVMANDGNEGVIAR
jgi:hypothetical protein